MRSLIFSTALCMAAQIVPAQQSLFQSGDGQTALYVRNSSASVNLGDSKANLGYTSETSTSPWSWGAGVYATANSGIASLFTSSKPKAPEGGGNAIAAYHRTDVRVGCPSGFEECPINVKENTFLLDVGYGHSSFYLFPTGLAPTASPAKTSFDRFRTILAWNLFASGNTIVGLAAGAERRNNLSDLKSVSEQTVIVPAPSGSATSVVSNQTGYYGTYKSYIGAPVYVDGLFYLPPKAKVPGFDSRLGIDLLSRSDVAAVNRAANGGIGLFIFDKKDPLKALVVITATYDGTNWQVSVVAGLTSSSK
ncbi:MAG: hypothetical protein ACRD51_14325 [Candidatus Acidiferrum sp.]